MVPDLRFRITAHGDTSRAFAGVRAEVSKTQAALAGLRSAGRTAIAGLGLGAGLGVGLLASRAREAIAEIDELADAAERAGVSAEGLQALRFGLEQTAGEAGQADAAMQRFSVAIGNAATTIDGPAAKAFARLGVSVRDQTGAIRENEDILRDLADRFAGLSDPSQQAALAAELFGRQAGPAMAVMLREGAAGIENYRRRLDEMGMLMSDEMVGRAGQLQNKFEEVGRFLDTRFKTVVVDVADALWYLHDTMVSIESRTNLAQLSDELDSLYARRTELNEAIGEAKAIYAGFEDSMSDAEKAVIAGYEADLRRVIEDSERVLARIAEVQAEAKAQRPGFERTDLIDPDGGRSSSTQSAAKQTTVAIRELYDELEVTRDLTKDWMQSFADGLLNGKSLVESLADATKGLASQLIRMGISTIAGSIFPTPGAAAGLYHSGGIAGSPAATRVVSPWAFAGAPRMHGGGLAGDEVPAILQRGERVLPRGASGAIIVNYAPRIDARGADRGGLDALVERLRRQIRDELPGAIRRARANREI